MSQRRFLSCTITTTSPQQYTSSSSCLNLTAPDWSIRPLRPYMARLQRCQFQKRRDSRRTVHTGRAKSCASRSFKTSHKVRAVVLCHVDTAGRASHSGTFALACHLATILQPSRCAPVWSDWRGPAWTTRQLASPPRAHGYRTRKRVCSAGLWQ